jgi:hypothetical protein
MKKKANDINDIKVEEIKKPVRRTTKRAEKITSEKNSVANVELADLDKALKDKEKKLEKSVYTKKKIIVEYCGKQVPEDLITLKLISSLKDSGFEGEVKTLNIYYKTEEETAYCIVNDGDPIVIKPLY